MIELEPYHTGKVVLEGPERKLAFFYKGMYVWQDGELLCAIEFENASLYLSEKVTVKERKQD